MTDNELFAKHAQSYLLCYNDKCPTRKQCLRWIIKDHKHFKSAIRENNRQRMSLFQEQQEAENGRRNDSVL